MDPQRRLVVALGLAIVAVAGAGLVRVATSGGLPKHYRIPGTAMTPTVQPGDRVRCSTDVPDRVARHTVVVVKAPPDPLSFGGWPDAEVMFRVVS